MSRDERIPTSYAASVERYLQWRARRDRPAGSESSPPTDAQRAADSLPEGEHARVLAEAEEAAALSGRVRPNDLFPATIADAVKQAVLTRLAPSCTVEAHADQLQWLLLHARRQEVLARLLEQDRLQERLAGPLPATDRCGDLLREVLKRGAKVTLARRSAADLTALGAAIEALGDLPLPHPDPADVRRVQAEKKGYSLEEYAPLLAHGFVGRRAELRHLRAFLADSWPSAPGPWDGLLLAGVGGAGKSTLLAKFAHEVIAKRQATLAILDFDRPGINPDDRDWLAAEVSRQVGRQYPEMLERLREVRKQARRHKAEGYETVVQSGLEAVSDERTRAADVIASIGAALRDAGAQGRPLLLVLDTFEEVTQREELVSPLYTWLFSVADALAPTRLKVIFSGRLFKTVVEVWVSFRNQITIGEMEPGLAQSLLERLGVARPMARRLVASQLLPRRPLELTLLARIMADEPDTSVETLEAEIRQATPEGEGRAPRYESKAIDQLTTGIIYRRVLNRLKNPVARQLAYPGLVLRYVTMELIRDVLSPALELPLSEAEAAEALNALASHTWLTYRDPSGEVWHRKDLRRLMVRLMCRTERETVDQISRKAIDHFHREGREEKDWAEGMYHRLMLTRTPADGESLELSDLKRAGSYIGADEADLPRAAAALLRFAVDGRVPMADVEALPGRYLPEAYDRTGQQLVRAREFGRALRLYERGRQAGLPGEWHRRSLISWEAETLFATASWDSLPRVAGPPVGLGGVRSLEALTPQLYPAEVVGRSRVSTLEIEEALLKEHLELFGYMTVFSDLSAGTTLARLIMSLLLHNHRSPFSEGGRQAALSLARSASDQGEKTLSVLLEWRLMLLRLAMGDRKPFELHLAPSTLKLDPQWLDAIGALVDPSNRFLIDRSREARATLEGVLRGKHRTARRVLGAFDALHKDRKRWSDVRIAFSPTDQVDYVWMLLRGPDPDFRDPCRYALMEIYRDRPSRRRLAQIIASVVPFPLEDLDPDTFADLIASDPEHGLEVYIELVDRLWTLGDLMRRVRDEYPEARKLKDVCAAHERWDAAVRAAVDRA